MKVKNLTVHQIIDISRKAPIDNFAQAEEIAHVLQDEKTAYIPKGEFFIGFWKMIAAIWCGGYIAGVQAERERRKGTRLQDNCQSSL